MALDSNNSSVRKGFLKDKKTCYSRCKISSVNRGFLESLDSKTALACYKCKKSSVKSNFLEVYTGFGLETSAKQLCANCFERGYFRIPGKAELFSMDFKKGTMYCIDDEAAAWEASLSSHNSWGVWPHASGQAVSGVSPRLGMLLACRAFSLSLC